jgi:hypothetical protein
MNERSTAGPTSTFSTAELAWCYCVRLDIGSPVGTKRFTDGGPLGDLTSNVDGTSQTWTKWPLRVGDLDQGDQKVLSVSRVFFGNTDDPPTFSGWAKTPGFRNVAAQVWRVYFDSTGAKVNQYKEYEGSVDNQVIGMWAELVFKPHHTPWSREAPWLTPPQLGAGALMPDPSVPVYFGDSPVSMTTRRRR